MTVLADTPTLGLLIGGPIAGLIFLACVGVAVLAARSDDPDAWLLLWSAVACALITTVVTLFAFWPLKHDYHFYVDKSGRVEHVAKRIINDGDGNISERFVLTIDGQPYGVDDTRAANVHLGDTVDIACKKEYQWGSKSHGWACRWNGGETAR